MPAPAGSNERGEPEALPAITIARKRSGVVVAELRLQPLPGRRSITGEQLHAAVTELSVQLRMALYPDMPEARGAINLRGSTGSALSSCGEDIDVDD